MRAMRGGASRGRWIVGWIVMALALPVWAVIQITITEAPEGALKIAVVPFEWTGAARYPPQSLATIISDDLLRSGRFDPLPARELLQRPAQSGDIRWADWRRLGIGNIVIGELEQIGGNGPGARYRVEFSLYDVFTRERREGLRDEIAGSELRQAAHQISDKIYEALTGERGASHTRIAFVTETANIGGSRYYAMKVADSDGYNSLPIRESAEPIMSPSWSHDGRRLAYVLFRDGKPGIYVQDLANRTHQLVASFPGINGAPAWSPDDSRLALTLSKDGNPEIYVLHLASGILQRMTQNEAIDTEAAWAPDGRSIVFTSDRGGRPQVYRVSSNGGAAERVTFEGDYNARPIFTPDGKQLIMVHAERGAYRIASLELETRRLTVLTNGTLDESPTVAPNGRMILYATTQGGQARLAVVSADGRSLQHIGEDEGAVRDPAWSPFLTTR